MRSTQPSFVLLMLAIGFGAKAAAADVWQMVGSRHQAMGGAGVAFSDDSLANYWNPANLAWDDKWDVQLPVTVNGSIENEALAKLSGLIVGFDELDPVAQQVVTCTQSCDTLPALSETQATDVAEFLAAFQDFGDGGEAVHIGADIGLAGRYKNFGFTALVLTAGTVYPSTDLGSLAIDAIGKVAACGGAGQPPCNTPSDTRLRDDVAASCGASCDLSTDQIGQLVWLLEEAGTDTGSDQTSQLLNGIVNSTGDLADGATGALVAGLASTEFGFGYARKLPVPFYDDMDGRTGQIFSYLHEKMSIGIVPKYMLGVTFIKFFSYATEEDVTGITSSFLDIDSSNVDHQFGLDLGFTWRPVDWFHFGFTARNINGPTFSIEPFEDLDGSRISQIRLDPQVRIGFAAYPIEHLTLALDVDATENEIATLPGFRSQIVSLGGEYRIPFWQKSGLALRLGAFSNVSDAVNDDWAMTGGIGLQLGNFVFDASAGGAFNKEVIRTGSDSFNEFPTRLNLGVGFKWEKQF